MLFALLSDAFFYNIIYESLHEKICFMYTMLYVLQSCLSDWAVVQFNQYLGCYSLFIMQLLEILHDKMGLVT